MFITNIDYNEAGIFKGKMVVSMRPIPRDKVVKSVLVSGSMPKVHGAPIHIGNPEEIGIKDINKPDFGDKVIKTALNRGKKERQGLLYGIF